MDHGAAFERLNAVAATVSRDAVLGRAAGACLGPYRNATSRVVDRAICDRRAIAGHDPAKPIGLHDATADHAAAARQDTRAVVKLADAVDDGVIAGQLEAVKTVGGGNAVTHSPAPAQDHSGGGV